jgi:hypothetical protein
MSSQASAGATGYTYPLTRDAQDWTRQLKEKREYYSYSTNNTGNTNTQDPWMKYGNDFKLVYDHGKLACGECTGNAFSSIVPNVVPAPLQNVIVADLNGIDFAHGGTYDMTFTFSSRTTLNVIFINTNVSINKIQVISFYDLNGTSFAVGSTFTIANPTLTPSIGRYLYPGGTNTILSAGEVAGFPLTPSSIISLTSVNPMTTVQLTFNL